MNTPGIACCLFDECQSAGTKKYYFADKDGGDMEHGKSTKTKRYLAIIVALGALTVLFLLLGPPELLARSEAPIFCGGG